MFRLGHYCWATFQNVLKRRREFGSNAVFCLCGSGASEPWSVRQTRSIMLVSFPTAYFIETFIYYYCGPGDLSGISGLVFLLLASFLTIAYTSDASRLVLFANQTLSKQSKSHIRILISEVVDQTNSKWTPSAEKTRWACCPQAVLKHREAFSEGTVHHCQSLPWNWTAPAIPFEGHGPVWFTCHCRQTCG